MPTPRNSYTLAMIRQQISTAITILQIKAGTQPLELIRAWIGQHTSSSTGQNQVSILRKSVGATVTAAILGTSLFKHGSTFQGASSATLSTTGTGVVATSEGTDSDEIISDAFNILNGFIWVPTQQSRIVLAPSDIIALKFVVAPQQQTYSASLTFTEEISQ